MRALRANDYPPRISLIFTMILALSSCTLAPTDQSGSNQSTSTSTAEKSQELSDTPEHDIDIPVEGKLSTKQPSEIDFQSPGGEIVYKMLHTREGGSALDGKNKVLLKFIDDRRVKSQKLVRIQNADGKLVGFIRIIGVYSIVVEDLKNKQAFKLHFENGGHFSLKDKEDNHIYKLVEDSEGLKVGTAGGNEVLFAVKVKDGKASLENRADGKALLCSRSEVPALVLACFALKELDKEQQLGLAYSLMFLRL